MTNGAGDPLDRLTTAAAALLRTPVASVSLVDNGNLSVRAGHGCSGRLEEGRKSFSDYAVELGPNGLLVIEDASNDPRFRDLPLVAGPSHARFYVGAVITLADGRCAGTLCALDREARATPSETELEGLRALAQTAADILDREAHRRDQDEQLKMLGLVESMSGVGHWRYDVANSRIEWSDAVYAIHGVSRDTFDPNAGDVLDFYHPDDREEVRRQLKQLIAEGGEHQFERRLIRADGEERIVQSRVSRERDPDGAVTAIFGVFQDVTQAHRTLTHARKNEARYRLLADNSVDVITRIRADGSSRYISPAIESLLGWKYEDMTGRPDEYVHPEDHPLLVGAILDVLAGGAPRSVQHRALHKDGSVVWVESRTRAIVGADGEAEEVIVAIRDVSERKVLEDQLQAALKTARRNEARYRLLAENSADVIARVKGDGSSKYISPAIRDLLGWTFDTMSGQAMDYVHPEDRAEVMSKIGAVLKGSPRTMLQHRALRKDGSVVWVESRFQSIGADEVIVVIRDISERKALEEKLQAALEDMRRSEERYRAIADRSEDIIITYSYDSIVTYASPALERISGIKPEEMVGTSVNRLLHPDDVAPTVHSLLSFIRDHPDREFTSLRYRGIDKYGQQRHYETRTRVVRDAEGRCIEVQDVARDVTATRRLEEELRAALESAESANQAKGEFLANMSHELRTPLTSIVGFAELLRGSEALPEEERRQVERIATGSEALLSVINDILDYSKLEAGALEMDARPFDPWTLAHTSAELMEAQRAAKRLKLAIDIDEAVPEALMGDEGRVRQVVLNFLSNAVKFTPSGEVRLVIGGRSDGDMWRLRVEVRDTGIGVAPGKLEALFDRFTQADQSITRTYGGTGLGLAICKRLVEAMGGEIGAHSEPELGSTFWFEAPFARAATAATAEPETVMPVVSARVLVADDAPANRELVSAILTHMGLEVETASDGAEAVEVLKLGRHDLVLMDMHMPVMDGVTAAREIRALGGDLGRTPILALTANVQAEQVRRCLEAGMDGHLAKPIDFAELARAVMRWTSVGCEGWEELRKAG